MESIKVVVVGSLNYDIIAKQERMPNKGETFIGNGVVQAPGGKGANQAAGCARLGLPTYMVGKVGDDRFGQAITGALQAGGVDVAYIKKLGITGLGLVHSMPDGDYYSTVIKGANDLVTEDDVDEVSDLISSSSYLILQQEIPQATVNYAINKFSDRDVQIILNNAPASNVPDDILRKVDVLIVNETEAGFMVNHNVHTVDDAKKAAAELFPKVKNMVIITLGIAGSVALTKDGLVVTTSVKAEAVDATGAGDSYIGGIVYGFSHGMTIKESMEFASNVSALTVTKNGGQDSFPTINEVKAMLRIHSNPV